MDKKSTQVLTIFNEKQKAFAKNAEKFNKIQDIVQSVERCNKSLKETIRMIQIANDELPDDLKLEPFVWTTG